VLVGINTGAYGQTRTYGLCIRFDGVPENSPLTGYSRVWFTNSDGGLTIVAANPGSPFTGPNSVLPDNYAFVGNRTRATPPRLVSAAQVTLGDFDGDEDTIYLEAYDATGGLVDSDTDVLPLSLNGGIDLHVQSDSTSIAYIEFWGVGGSENSVYFDNVCFGP